MNKLHCVIDKVLDFQLGTGTFPGHSNAASAQGFDPLTLIPFMTIPFLMVLVAGLWMMDQYRRRTSL